MQRGNPGFDVIDYFSKNGLVMTRVEDCHCELRMQRGNPGFDVRDYFSKNGLAMMSAYFNQPLMASMSVCANEPAACFKRNVFKM